VENYFEKQFELRYFEMNKFGEAMPTSILTLLEEAAAEHCFSIDYSLYDLQKQNIGWVLLSGLLVMDRYPVYKEKITIRTWLSSYSAVKGFRENIIYDEQHRIIGRSKGLWVFFDINKRRPVRIYDDILNKWSFNNEECVIHDITEKIEPIEFASFVKEFKICHFDEDTNHHVNNIKYFQWMLESVPEEIINNYYLYSIDGRFIAEAQYGDTITSFTERDIHSNTFIHSIKAESNDKFCAVAKTIWKERNK